MGALNLEKNRLRQHAQRVRQLAFAQYHRAHQKKSGLTFLKGLKNFLNDYGFAPPADVMLYCAFGYEAPTQTLISFLWKNNYNVFLPKVQDHTMVYVRYERDTPLKKHKNGFMEPCLSSKEIHEWGVHVHKASPFLHNAVDAHKQMPVPFCESEVLAEKPHLYDEGEQHEGAPHPCLYIVPLLAFDGGGGRLGYGKGHYDSYFHTCMEKNSKLLQHRMGLAFDAQEVKCVPTDTHDISLTGVITPGKYRIF